MTMFVMIGIPSNRIIEGTVAANTLNVPEMGRCGAPSLTQINWLRTIIPSTIPVHPNSIILIKRTRKRVMQKFNAIQQPYSYSIYPIISRLTT
jgi:hypothetical protein